MLLELETNLLSNISGQMVVIEKGQTMLLDIDTPVLSVLLIKVQWHTIIHIQYEGDLWSGEIETRTMYLVGRNHTFCNNWLAKYYISKEYVPSVSNPDCQLLSTLLYIYII